ncbi:MAG TPA: hydantoinase/oxoprolinase family protein, partial [Acidimicrobiia bacterium]|nr:hydantoinase/oxoprolinase family protein [Acidimicrobiia bacterium]
GVDIGGTFTDAVAISADGTIQTAKALTTPGHLHDGVLTALEQLEVDWGTLEAITHGTTAGLNAFLERRGARVALLTTKGFRDVYELGRANRPDMYNVRYRPPTPLVRRRSIFEVDERMAPDGSTIVAVDAASVGELIAEIGSEYDAVAVCLLHAYANPQHEQQVAAIVREVAPGLSVVTSHEVAPEWREYERTSTTVIAAYIAPIVERYLAELEDRVTEKGLAGPLRVMQSNGGVMTVSFARGKPIQTLFSGPVGGTIASVAVAEDLVGEFDADRLICVDMGGTSFDMSLVVDGKAEVELQSTLEGHPVLAPSVAIHTMGAGGGSVGHTEGGGLRVGPRSAGAEPGPACYGGGGTEPTITDANLHLGRIPSAARLAGGMALDESAAQAVLESVGGQLGLDATQLASGMVAVADAAMANGIREITVLRGIDPREFTLVAFGGAGPLHALAIAEELAIARVIVPADPGVLSAYGMLQSDTRHDVVQSFYVRVADVRPEALEEAFAVLEERGRAMLTDDDVAEDLMLFESAADLRYSGQEYTVTLDLDMSKGVASLLERLPDQFALAHEARYGHSNPGESVEFVNLRLAAYGRIDRPGRSVLPAADGPAPVVAAGQAWFGDGWAETSIHRRSDLLPGHHVSGPAIVLEDACTTLVLPAWEATVSSRGHLLISRTG